MRTTKFLVAAFAVFSTMMLLSTSVFAQPVSVKLTEEAIFNDSCEDPSSDNLLLDTISKISNDYMVKDLINKLSEKQELQDIFLEAQSIDSADDMTAISEKFITTLSQQYEYTRLEQAISLKYSDAFDNMNDFVFNPNVDFTSSQNAFMTNLNGDVYIPGYGWISGDLWNLIIDFLDGLSSFFFRLSFELIPSSLIIGSIAAIFTFIAMVLNGGNMTDFTDISAMVYAFFMALPLSLIYISGSISDLADWMRNNPP